MLGDCKEKIGGQGNGRRLSGINGVVVTGLTAGRLGLVMIAAGGKQGVQAHTEDLQEIGGEDGDMHTIILI